MIRKFKKINETNVKNSIEKYENYKFKIEIQLGNQYLRDKNVNDDIKNNYDFLSVGLGIFDHWIIDIFHQKFKSKIFTRKNAVGVNPEKVALVQNDTIEKIRQLLISENFDFMDKYYQKSLTFSEIIDFMKLINSTF